MLLLQLNIQSFYTSESPLNHVNQHPKHVAKMFLSFAICSSQENMVFCCFIHASSNLAMALTLPSVKKQLII